MHRISFLVMVCMPGSVFAQPDTTDTRGLRVEEVSAEAREAFEGASDRSMDQISLHPAQLVAGHFCLSYQRWILDQFTLRVTAGAVLPEFGVEFPSRYGRLEEDIVDEDGIPLLPSGGWSFALHPAWRTEGEYAFPFFFIGSDEFSIGLQWRRRHYTFDGIDATVEINDFYLQTGAHRELGDHWWLDLMMGFGYRSARIEPSTNENDLLLLGTPFILPIEANFSYRF